MSENETVIDPPAAVSDVAAPTPAETAPAPTPDEIKAQQRKDREARINARIEELKSYEGKTFVRNDGTGLPVKVIKYAGMFLKEGRMIYTFEVETPGHAAWKPSATDFLAEYHVIETAATATEVEPY